MKHGLLFTLTHIIILYLAKFKMVFLAYDCRKIAILNAKFETGF